MLEEETPLKYLSKLQKSMPNLLYFSAQENNILANVIALQAYQQKNGKQFCCGTKLTCHFAQFAKQDGNFHPSSLI